ncbi:peptidoglycan-binding protein [Streptomyces sp. NPDC046557]|uniref:peptidoglycan-binding domain-containing protein n=1 Tax=Streptomyces sp. NPDC046557 TaxID=3155372 RepID=UPI0033E2C9E6
MPDDGPLARPYVAPPDHPSPATHAQTWPEGGAPAVRGPEPSAIPGPIPSPTAARSTATWSAGQGSGAHGRRRGGGQGGPAVPITLALLALVGAGGLVFLLSGPDPERPRAAAPPGLTVPVLPARGPDAEPGPSSAVPTRPKTPAPTPGSTTPSGAVSAASPDARPRGPIQGAPSAAPPPPADDSRTLRQGDKGPEVRELQQRLYDQGFTYVAVTGVYDGRTRRGVAQLQRDRDIKGDPPGVYGPATRAAFG